MKLRSWTLQRYGIATSRGSNAVEVPLGPTIRFSDTGEWTRTGGMLTLSTLDGDTTIEILPTDTTEKIAWKAREAVAKIVPTGKRNPIVGQMC